MNYTKALSNIVFYLYRIVFLSISLYFLWSAHKIIDTGTAIGRHGKVINAHEDLISLVSVLLVKVAFSGLFFVVAFKNKKAIDKKTE